ncbi:DUF927 domain-containing protein [Tropicimonas sp. IMCC6043]|uniref:DUF927 domain-containing protein n=1 Tax=Tropicimonas sp. IMCC6043 TaxID=2510645 RepID=UPI00101D7960|nr:DUF927 domain-containing protein [Tropicimonas sp. IMCC6043]RYH06101.1 DUF927 domain-containing protein [Tropicimonas sp. IMCC6043]
MALAIRPFEMTAEEASQAEADSANPPPRGFSLRPDGIHYEVEKDGESEWRWLCSPIRVLALPRGADGKGWGRLVEIVDPDGNRHRWAMPAELFAGDGTELRRECMRLGLRLSTSRNARAVFSDLLQTWTPEVRATTAERLGWADETCSAFVLGSGRVIGDDNVVFQSEHAPGAAAEMRCSGTLEQWRDSVGAACTGNPLMIVAVSLAFAGALLEPLQTEGGGLHLRGASSRGKSTILRAAVSVWGSPRFLQSWRATSNGLEGTAAACNGSLIALDEMGEISAREAGATAYMLANGQGKARATRAGTARPAARWRTAILSSGEIRLADKLAEAGQRVRAGQEVRLLDIQADGRLYGAFDILHDHADAAAFSEAVTRMAAAAYGTAGPAFVERLVVDMEEATRQSRAFASGFKDHAMQRFDLVSEGQTSRALARLGLIAAAGELATAWGISGWPAGSARDAALDVFGLWLAGRGGAGPTEAREALQRLRAFISAHGISRFEDLDEEDARPVLNRAGWRSGTTYYISADAWRDIHSGADTVDAARHVRDAGYLAPGDGNNLAQRAPRSVPNRPRVYVVSGEILGAGDD